MGFEGVSGSWRVTTAQGAAGVTLAGAAGGMDGRHAQGGVGTSSSPSRHCSQVLPAPLKPRCPQEAQAVVWAADLGPGIGVPILDRGSLRAPECSGVSPAVSLLAPWLGLFPPDQLFLHMLICLDSCFSIAVAWRGRVGPVS